jgi:TCP-1/cpn60 chaperonin family
MERYKIQTALHSSRAALANGVIPGGGLSLLKSKLAVSHPEDNSVSPGYHAVTTALESPIRQQILNAHGSEQQVIDAIESNSDPSVGFDADSGRVCDLSDAGIIDSTRIVVSALQLAFAHARAILQTGVWDISADSPTVPSASPWDEVPRAEPQRRQLVCRFTRVSLRVPRVVHPTPTVRWRTVVATCEQAITRSPRRCRLIPLTGNDITAMGSGRRIAASK